MYWNILFNGIQAIKERITDCEHPKQHAMYICTTVSIYDISVLKAIIKYYHKRQSQKVASPGNSFGIGSVLNWFIKVTWPTESVDTNQQTPVYRFLTLNTRYIAPVRLSGISNIPQGLPLAYLRSPILIGDNKREYLSHERWIHGTFLSWHFSCEHHVCDVVSQISRHSQLCWTIWLQIKLKAQSPSPDGKYQIIFNFVKTFHEPLSLCLFYLWSVCRRPFIPTDSF